MFIFSLNPLSNTNEPAPNVQRTLLLRFLRFYLCFHGFCLSDGPATCTFRGSFAQVSVLEGLCCLYAILVYVLGVTKQRSCGDRNFVT